MRSGLLVVALTLAIAGCGTSREQVEHREEQTKTVAVERTRTERTAFAPDGQPYVELTVTTRALDQISRSEADAKISAQTTLHVPEIAATVNAVANVVAPGTGGALAAALRWLTGTPDGAALGLVTASTIAVGARKALTDRAARKRESEDRDELEADFDRLVKATSDYMQAHPDQAAALKAAHSKAQDQTTKQRVRASRVKQGLG